MLNMGGRRSREALEMIWRSGWHRIPVSCRMPGPAGQKRRPVGCSGLPGQLPCQRASGSAATDPSRRTLGEGHAFRSLSCDGYCASVFVGGEAGAARVLGSNPDAGPGDFGKNVSVSGVGYGPVSASIQHDGEAERAPRRDPTEGRLAALWRRLPGGRCGVKGVRDARGPSGPAGLANGR
jgi:hypothetical protein